MPQYNPPSSFPDWSSGQATQVSAPTPAMQASGFTSGQRPAFQTLNWLFYTVGGWIRYFSQGINAIMTGAAQEPGYRLIGGGSWSWNATTGVLAWSESFAISMPGLADASNTGAPGSVTLAAGQVAYTASNAPFTTTGNTTTGSNQLTNLAFESGIAVGENVTGVGIPTGTTVTAISATDSSVTLSAAATATASNVSVTFATSGPLTVQVANVSALAVAPNTIVLARCVGVATGGNQVIVGVNSGQMLLRHLEAKPLLSNGYVVTQRIKAAVNLSAGYAVYVSPGNPTDSLTYIRSGTDTTTTSLYTDAVNNVIVPANQIAVGDTVVSGGTSTVTSVNANGTFTVSPPLPQQNEGLSPYPITRITIYRQQGLVYPTDASPNMPLCRGQAIGIVPLATAAGATAHVVQSGTVQNFGALTPGAPYYLSAAPNAIGQSTLAVPSASGTLSTIIGVATSPTSLMLNPAAYTQASVIGTGYKAVVDMGYFWSTNTTVPGLQSTLDVLYNASNATAFMVHRYVFTHSGSIVGLSVHLNNTVSPTTTVYLGKATGVACSLDIQSGKQDASTAFPKGTYTFAAGEPLYAYIYFAGQTGINCAARIYATIEYNNT